MLNFGHFVRLGHRWNVGCGRLSHEQINSFPIPLKIFRGDHRIQFHQILRFQKQKNQLGICGFLVTWRQHAQKADGWVTHSDSHTKWVYLIELSMWISSIAYEYINPFKPDTFTLTKYNIHLLFFFFVYYTFIYIYTFYFVLYLFFTQSCFNCQLRWCRATARKKKKKKKNR